jgi:catechol 2,3-dioxygenase-like lactoylglutathione lyase family enzyme
MLENDMRLNQVTAPANNLDASIAFYELLGLRLIVKSPHYARFELPKGEATFSLHVVDGPIPRANAPHLYFELSEVGLDAEVERLKAAGVVFENEPKLQTWLWREAWLRDPAGNAICLYFAGENRRFPPWRVDAPPGPSNLHLVIRDSGFVVVKSDAGAEAWRGFQESYTDFKTSLGPYDLHGLLSIMEIEWPEEVSARHERIRAFAESDATSFEF